MATKDDIDLLRNKSPEEIHRLFKAGYFDDRMPAKKYDSHDSRSRAVDDERKEVESRKGHYIEEIRKLLVRARYGEKAMEDGYGLRHAIHLFSDYTTPFYQDLWAQYGPLWDVTDNNVVVCANVSLDKALAYAVRLHQRYGHYTDQQAAYNRAIVETIVTQSGDNTRDREIRLERIGLPRKHDIALNNHTAIAFHTLVQESRVAWGAWNHAVNEWRIQHHWAWPHYDEKTPLPGERVEAKDAR